MIDMANPRGVFQLKERIVDGKRVSVGTFDTEEAAIARLRDVALRPTGSNTATGLTWATYWNVLSGLLGWSHRCGHTSEDVRELRRSSGHGGEMHNPPGHPRAAKQRHSEHDLDRQVV